MGLEAVEARGRDESPDLASRGSVLILRGIE